MKPFSVSQWFFQSVIAVWQLIGSTSCQDGLRITLGGREIPNHGLLATQEIGGSETILAEGLACTYPPGRNANWIRADGFTVERVAGHLFTIRWIGNTVYLFRNPLRMASDFQMFGDGIWQCASDGTEQKFIGIYSEANKGIISHGTPGDIQFSLVTEDPLTFNLTFNTTGGPASYVTWTRDGVNITTLEDNRFVTSQTVGHVQHIFVILFLEDYRAGNYSNTLTLAGRLPGVYGVSVTNDRTLEPVTNQFTVLGVGEFAAVTFQAEEDAESSAATILGGVMGGVVGLLLLVISCFIIVSKRRCHDRCNNTSYYDDIVVARPKALTEAKRVVCTHNIIPEPLFSTASDQYTDHIYEVLPEDLETAISMGDAMKLPHYTLSNVEEGQELDEHHPTDTPDYENVNLGYEIPCETSMNPHIEHEENRIYTTGQRETHTGNETPNHMQGFIDPYTMMKKTKHTLNKLTSSLCTAQMRTNHMQEFTGHHTVLIKRNHMQEFTGFLPQSKSSEKVHIDPQTV